MSVDALVDELVEDGSLDALERLTGSRSDEVLAALVGAAARIIESEQYDETEDRIVETIRLHLVESKAVGVLIDALSTPSATTREFALACLGEIGDTTAVAPMINLLDDDDAGVREAAAEHLALLTRYDFGRDAEKWREWHRRLVKGRHEQVEEDREDEQRLLRLKLRGKGKEEEEDEAATLDDPRFY